MDSRKRTLADFEKLFREYEKVYSAYFLTSSVDEFEEGYDFKVVGLLKKFLSENYYSILVLNTHIIIKWVDMIEEYFEEGELGLISKQLHMHPENTIKLISMIYHSIYILKKQTNAAKIFSARIYQYNRWYSLNDLKSKSFGRFVALKASVLKIQPRTYVISEMTFKCKKCGSLQTKKFDSFLYSPPAACKTNLNDSTAKKCFGKKFEPVRDSTRTTDYQVIKIQDSLQFEYESDERNGSMKSVDCHLSDDLVNCCSPGDEVIVTGIVSSEDNFAGKRYKNQQQNKQAVYTLNIIVNSVENLSADENSLFKKIKQIPDVSYNQLSSMTQIDNLYQEHQLGMFDFIRQKPNIFECLVNSLCPKIIGFDHVKAGILLTIASGRLDDEKNFSGLERSNSHMLIVGDPGLGKSQLLLNSLRVAPKGHYVCGNSASSTGLTVSLSKSANSGAFSIDAGALVLSDRGVCAIDEFDKMGAQQHASILEAMEQQKVSIAKSGVLCSLNSRCSIICAANPVGGHFNLKKKLSDNIKIEPAVLSRFDLICILTEHNRNNSQIADQVLSRYNSAVSSDGATDLISASVLRSYIASAMLNYRPVLSEECQKFLTDHFLSVRKNYDDNDNDEGGATPRYLQCLIRLVKSRCKLMCRDECDVSDAQFVVDLLRKCSYEGQKEQQKTKNLKSNSKAAKMKNFLRELSKNASYTTEQLKTLFQVYLKKKK